VYAILGVRTLSSGFNSFIKTACVLGLSPLSISVLIAYLLEIGQEEKKVANLDPLNTAQKVLDGLGSNADEVNALIEKQWSIHRLDALLHYVAKALNRELSAEEIDLITRAYLYNSKLTEDDALALVSQPPGPPPPRSQP
jgi:hypothetical protein